jgi:beta-mannanase
MKTVSVRKSWLAGLSVAASLLAGQASAAEVKLLPPETGAYHGVFANIPEYPARGDVARYTRDFERLVGKDVALTIIGDEWTESIRFPAVLAGEARNSGYVPVIHIRPWSVKRRFTGQDPRYSLQRIIDGWYDNELRAYARDVRNFRQPVLLSFAPEANGNWYPWSGAFAGGEYGASYGDPILPDGPERYRDAYRRFVDIFRQERVENASWVFHISSASKPEASWNEIHAYYPGDEYVDWLAVSVYSAQVPGDYWSDFSAGLDAPYAALSALSADKPIAVLEYGTIEDRAAPLRKADWITAALTSVKFGWYPRIKAMAYWHESSWMPWENNDMRVSSSTSALDAYRQEIADPFFVSRPVLSRDPNPPQEGCVCGWVETNNIRYCAIWKPGDAQVREARRFSQCDLAVCQQLFTPDTVQGYCGGRVSMFQQ